MHSILSCTLLVHAFNPFLPSAHPNLFLRIQCILTPCSSTAFLRRATIRNALIVAFQADLAALVLSSDSNYAAELLAEAAEEAMDDGKIKLWTQYSEQAEAAAYYESQGEAEVPPCLSASLFPSLLRCLSASLSRSVFLIVSLSLARCLSLLFCLPLCLAVSLSLCLLLGLVMWLSLSHCLSASLFSLCRIR